MRWVMASGLVDPIVRLLCFASGSAPAEWMALCGRLWGGPSAGTLPSDRKETGRQPEHSRK